MFKPNRPSFSVSFARLALESIFDECDQHDSHETGGRLIGTYQKRASSYDIQVLGVLGPGPRAQRSATSFFQDGEHQERIFRKIEETHPEVEHLGNWHTHHVNGLSTLSGGDHATYHRIVNHHNHNTDFFYALLVVKKNDHRNPRYEVKHFFFRRDEGDVYEIPNYKVRIVDTPTLWPLGIDQAESPSTAPERPSQQPLITAERVKDQEFFSDFYPSLRPLLSKSAGAMYWKGPITLIDDSSAEVTAIENSADGESFYSITTDRKEPDFAALWAQYGERSFRSARHAVLHLQDDLNRAIYRNKRG
ncbi:MAG: hypothetical protein ABSB50_01390 [Terracidiphilus sp.]|jgi:hypothetical protein